MPEEKIKSMRGEGAPTTRQAALVRLRNAEGVGKKERFIVRLSLGNLGGALVFGPHCKYKSSGKGGKGVDED